MFLVVLDHFPNDEIEEILGEFGVEIGIQRHALQPLDLLAFAQRIRGREVVFSLKLTHGLRVFETFGQCVDQDRVKPINRLAMPNQQFGGAGGGVSQLAFLSA